MKKINLEDYEKLIYEINDPIDNIIFIHGFGGNMNGRNFLKDHLKDSYNFYSINLPGHGKSKFDSLSQIDFLFYVDVAKAFIDSLNLKSFILYGHSMGGGISLKLSTIYQNKISNLILESPANPTILDNHKMISKLIPNSIKEIVFLYNNLFYDFKKIFPDQKKRQSFLEKEFIKSMQTYYLKRMLNPAKIKMWMNIVGEAIETNKIPTLLFLGKQDNIVTSQYTYNLFSKYKNYQIEIIDNSGHLPIVEQKEKCLSIIDFFLLKNK